jgi:CRP/FNR family transcriptional regulator, cyclic AMP receptor protein
MDVSSSFFDYPTLEPEREPPAELILLAEATEEDWAKVLECTEMRRFRSGDLVVAAGQRDRSLYLLTDGLLVVEIPDERRTGMLIEAPAVVGEVAFLDGSPRSASLRARTDGEMLRLSWESFEAFSTREQFLARQILLDLGRILAARLRKAETFPADGTL